MEEIADGTDPRLEAVRLAPSGTNAQPCFLFAMPARFTYIGKMRFHSEKYLSLA